MSNTEAPKQRQAEYLTVVFKVVPGDDVAKIHASGNWVASSWSHALNDRDDALRKLEQAGIE